MNIQRVTYISAMVVALAMVLFQLLSVFLIIQPYFGQLNTHVGLALLVVFLGMLAKAKGKRRLWYLSMAILSLITYTYIQVLWPQLQMRTFFNTNIDLAIGILLILLAFEATRENFGLLLPVLTFVVFLYPFIGQYLPEPFYVQSYGFKQVISQLSIGLTGSGLLGTMASISYQYIFLFIVFGGLLGVVGGISFFLALAKMLVGKLRGGPALIAVVASALFGTLSGSAFANVAVTGVFTIPLMKKTGYKPEHAGAIEAAASNGGLIMPPVMGAGAFVMAGLTDIPYINICIMAATPAILYYLTTASYVILRAGQLRVSTMSAEDQKVDIRELLLEAPKFVLPFAIIVYFLSSGYSVMYASFWAIVSMVAAAMVRKKNRPSLSKLVRAFAEGAETGAGIAVSISLLAILATTFTMTGLGVRLSMGLEQWSGGSLLVGVLILWVIIIVLGMGGIGIATYVVLSIFAVPTLMRMGVPFAQAHFFILFASTFVGVTPPVAPVAVVAAKLAGCDYFKTSLECGKVAAAGILLPISFVYAPIILLQPKSPITEVIVILSFMVGLFELQVGTIGYYFTACNRAERVLAIVSMLILFSFIPIQNYALFIIGLIMFIALTMWQWRRRLALAPSMI